MQISLAVFNCSLCKSPPDVPPPLNYKKLKIHYNKHFYFLISKPLLQNLRVYGTFLDCGRNHFVLFPIAYTYIFLSALCNYMEISVFVVGPLLNSSCFKTHSAVLHLNVVIVKSSILGNDGHSTHDGIIAQCGARLTLYGSNRCPRRNCSSTALFHCSFQTHTTYKKHLLTGSGRHSYNCAYNF